MGNESETVKSRSIGSLLQPHLRELSLGLIAVVGEGAASLLEPWPLKVVLDCVIKSRPGAGGRVSQLILLTFHDDKIAVLKFAAIAVLAIAAVGAICSYAEKFLTTTVGQWVMYDLRRTLYSHIQRLSLDYHDHKRTGDLISRITTDIDAIQSLIASSLLGSFIDILTLLGMVAIMFFLNWRVHADCPGRGAHSFPGGVRLHAPHQESFARGAQKRRGNCLGDPGGLILDSGG